MVRDQQCNARSSAAVYHAAVYHPRLVQFVASRAAIKLASGAPPRAEDATVLAPPWQRHRPSAPPPAPPPGSAVARSPWPCGGGACACACTRLLRLCPLPTPFSDHVDLAAPRHTYQSFLHPPGWHPTSLTSLSHCEQATAHPTRARRQWTSRPRRAWRRRRRRRMTTRGCSGRRRRRRRSSEHAPGPCYLCAQCLCLRNSAPLPHNY